MPHIQANGIRIHYELYGSGTPLFLIGGYTQHKLAWTDYFEPLSKKFQVIAFDNRGCGQTDSPNEPYSIKMLAQDTAALMEELKIKSGHFLGQSMGCAIIQKMCINHPHKVRKAVLCAPFATLPPISRYKGQALLDLLQMGVEKRALFKLNASWMLSNRFIQQPGGSETFIKLAMEDPFPQPMEGLLGQADALFACDLRSQIHKIPHEILLLIGGKDIATPPYCAEEIAKSVQRAKTHTFDEMGHLFPWEIPEKVIKQVFKFLI